MEERLARNLYELALERAPGIAMHQRIPQWLQPFPESAAVLALLQQAVALDPLFAPAHAALGNMWVRFGRSDEAIAAYRRAVEIDPELAEVHYALAQAADDPLVAEEHVARALQRRVLFSTVPAAPRRSVLVLYAPRPWHANAPLDFVLDPERNAIHRLFLTDDALDRTTLPQYDVVFNAIGEAVAAHPALRRAAAFIASQDKPVINLPHRLARTARPVVRGLLEWVPRCVVPATVRLARERVRIPARMSFPVLVRPIDTFGGRGLERADDDEAFATYLARQQAPFYDVAEFVDYRGDDGFYRKYRVVCVDGKPFPYHCAISADWMVHYYTAPMAEHAWMRDEEARFMEDPISVFPSWDATFGAIARAVGLDYFGIDCGRTADGNALVFEIDAAMLVHNVDSPQLYPYKHALVPRIFSVVERMLEERSLAHELHGEPGYANADQTDGRAV